MPCLQVIKPVKNYVIQQPYGDSKRGNEASCVKTEENKNQGVYMDEDEISIHFSSVFLRPVEKHLIN